MNPQNSIHIIEAEYLTVGDVISWNGLATMIGGYRLDPSTADAVELTLFVNNDEDRKEMLVVPLSKRIRVLVPYGLPKP